MIQNGKELLGILFQTVFLGNTLGKWLISVLLVVLSYFAILFLKALLIQKASIHSASKFKNFGKSFEDVLQGTRKLFLFVIAFYVGIQVLVLPPHIIKLLGKIVALALMLQAILWGSRLITLWVKTYTGEPASVDVGKVTTIKAIGGLGKFALWVALFLLALDNFGVNITTLIAGLGIGGIAIALAAKKILEDLFASLSIVLDKPFVLGDLIVVGSEKGTIEKIGIKSTRVRSLSGEQLIFPNSDVLSSRIRNFKRMEERRIVFRFGVIYQSTYEQLKKIPDIVKSIITSVELARLERVHFASFGESSLDFEVVYWVKSPEYPDYMNVQQMINLELYKQFREEGISFAYPTRTLHINNVS